MTGGLVRCLACNASGPRTRTFRRGIYQLATCARCGLKWIIDPPQGEELAELYATGFYEPGPARASRLAELVHEYNNAFRTRELRGLRPGRLLDVGSGRGRFLAAVKAAGWTATGIEFEPGLAAMARARYSVDVVVGDAVTADVEGPFAVVTMWHVLEHLSNPAESLERAHELLAPGGRLIVSVPNNASWQARAGGDDWLHLDIPRHIYHFTPRSLSLIIERAGFRVERIGFLYPEMEILGVLQTALNRIGVGPDLLYRFAKRDETARLGPEVLLSLGLAAVLAPIALTSAVRRRRPCDLARACSWSHRGQGDIA